MFFNYFDLSVSIARINSFAAAASLAVLTLVCFAAPSNLQAQVAPATVNDGHGRVWMQLPQTAGASWNQVAQICPRDGVTPCDGSVGGRNLNDWVWANDAQVLQLMSYYEPAMLTNRSVSGMQYFFTGQTFLSAFQPTFSSCGTYQCGAYAAGWTATKDENNLPIFGAVSWGNTPVSIGGSFGVGPDSNADNSLNERGVWLFQAANGTFAYNDAGQVASPDGGTAVSNVLANDRIAGVGATFANVRISQLSSTNTGVTLDVFDGSVDVSSGTPAGIYTLVYRMCNISDAADCDNANVMVTVNPYTIDAVNDYGIVSPSTASSAIGSVLANDNLSGGSVTTANAILSRVSVTPNNAGISLDLSDGSVDVAAGTALGTYSVIYQICVRANPAVCDQATATVVVQNYSIDAVNDYVRASSKVGSSPLNVLTNDTFNGAAATTNKVRISQVSPAISGITLNLSTGLISVATKTSSGI